LEAEEVGEVGISDKVEAEATATGAFLPVAVLRGGGPSHPGAAVAVVAPIPGLLHPLAPGLVLPLAPDKYWALLHPQTRVVKKKEEEIRTGQNYVVFLNLSSSSSSFSVVFLSLQPSHGRLLDLWVDLEDFCLCLCCFNAREPLCHLCFSPRGFDG